jgi:hypothetical protein
MLGRSDAAERHYRAERAVAADESVSWVVVDEDLELHVEACAYLAGLRGAGRAFNTEKTWLVDEPMPSRSRKPGAAVRYRSEGTANAIMGTVGDSDLPGRGSRRATMEPARQPGRGCAGSTVDSWRRSPPPPRSSR